MKNQEMLSQQMLARNSQNSHESLAREHGRPHKAWGGGVAEIPGSGSQNEFSSRSGRQIITSKAHSVARLRGLDDHWQTSPGLRVAALHPGLYAVARVRGLKTLAHHLMLICLGASLLTACTGKQPAPNQASPTPATPAQPVWYKVDSATAGTITGKVSYTGKKPLATKVNMDNAPECALLHDKPVLDEKIAATKDGGLANAFVYIKQGLEGKQFEPPAEPAVIDQKGCWFGPRVLGVQVGQTLKVTNSDPLTHNIHPMPEHNRDWNQSQGPGAEPFLRRFTHPEVMIRVKCNIHSWMHAWVGVVAHPYFAVTGADGAFQLRNVPPGNYTVEVWQEELGKQEQQITLATASQSAVVFNLK